MNLRHVISSHELLMEKSNRQWGKSALVFDDAGHYEGVAAAEFLVSKGVSVTFATGLSSFAPGLETSLSCDPALERLAKGDFRLITYARLDEVHADTVMLSTRYSGRQQPVPAETVVFVSHNRSNRDLVDALADWPGHVAIVGDARSARYLQTAIREGHLAARAID